jgi:murein DD-endopeptidase MepM/ murein hydrolase activator NlpD
MRKILFCLILNFLLASSCTAHGPFYVGNLYGAPVSYGERRHAGIDFDIRRGTPIIAASDGEVTYVGDPCPSERRCGGIFVILRHGNHFKSIYGHLGKVFVKTGQLLKRGQLIGLSGASNSGYTHLHFTICKIGADSMKYSHTYSPETFWLGGKSQCFDPNTDYSSYSQKDIILPVACGEYAKALISQTEGKD